MKMIRLAFAAMLFWSLSAVLGMAHADAYKPFVHAYNVSGSDHVAAASEAAGKLEESGFTLLGEYDVSASARVIIATNEEMLSVAGSTERGGYIAPLRVSATQVGGQVQVSYTNPEYFRIAYGASRTLAGVKARLNDVLGAEQDFGAEGMDESTLARYRYAFGMERFTNPMRLNQFPSHQAAVAGVTQRLAAKEAGVSEIYRLEIPGTEQTLIGVAIRESDGASQDSADRHNLESVDVGDLRHTAYVPYELLIDGRNVEALHMRYRMALHFPDLRMMGGPASFMSLRASPGAVEETLTKAAGGVVGGGF